MKTNKMENKMKNITQKYNLSDIEKRDINRLIERKNNMSLDDINFMIVALEPGGYLHSVWKNDEFRDCQLEIYKAIK
jgi:hypothetical protein